MAEVTGFTADRMRVIENTTVVDGEVQGDNLVLMTREGTPIDAGNVRGPQGDQGIPGPVQSTNDQIGEIYAPRIFTAATEMPIAWPEAPEGAFAVVKTGEGFWGKGQDGLWTLRNTVRTFPNVDAMVNRWANAPVGAMSILADNNSVWKKYVGGWTMIADCPIFTSVAQRDSFAPNPGNGQECQAPPGLWWVGKGGIWTPRVGLLWAAADEQYTENAYADTSKTWVFTDSMNFPFPTVAVIQANVHTTGWDPQFTPVADIYSNDVASPWVYGAGHSFVAVRGRPYNPNEIGNTAEHDPQQMPSMVAIHKLAAGAGLSWFVRVQMHGGAGAINWSGGYSVLLQRFAMSS